MVLFTAHRIFLKPVHQQTQPGIGPKQKMEERARSKHSLWLFWKKLLVAREQRKNNGDGSAGQPAEQEDAVAGADPAVDDELVMGEAVPSTRSVARTAVLRWVGKRAGSRTPLPDQALTRRARTGGLCTIGDGPTGQEDALSRKSCSQCTSCVLLNLPDESCPTVETSP